MRANTTDILFNDPVISSPVISVVRIHPLVIFQMADSYERRESKGDSAIGVIFGDVVENEAIVLDCYPCLPNEQTVVNKDLMNALYQEHRQLYPNEIVLGYYTFSQRQIDFPDILGVGTTALHIWMRPAIPPKIDVFSITKTEDSKIISTPVEYMIDASEEEQLGLSRLIDDESRGSLQAAVNELLNLFQTMEKKCRQTTGRHARDKIVGREIHKALSQTTLKESSQLTLKSAKEDIDRFLQYLDEAEGNAIRAEHILSLEFK